MAHIDTSEVIRGAIWIRPNGDALENITRLIRTMHKRAGGPQVQPHLTLLSGLETTQANAELKLKDLAQRIKPFTVQLGELEAHDDYFKALIARAGPQDALTAAQRDAYDAFEMKPAPPFEPHLSLLYGKIDEALKRELIAEAGGKLDVAFDVHAVQLVNASQGLPVTAWKTLAEHAVG